MSKTAIKFTPFTYSPYEEFTIEVDATDADRIKRLIERALADHSLASSKRDRERAHARMVDAKRARTAERTRLRTALKRVGIDTANADSWNSGDAKLETTKDYSEETTNGWMRLSDSRRYSLLDMVAKLGKQSAVEWELRRESRGCVAPTAVDVLYVRLPELIEV